MAFFVRRHFDDFRQPHALISPFSSDCRTDIPAKTVFIHAVSGMKVGKTMPFAPMTGKVD